PLLETNARHLERLLRLLQQPRLKDLDLLVRSADVLHMLGDGLRQLVLRTKQLGLRAMFGAECRLNFPLALVPQWNGNAQPGSDRLVPGLAMIGSLDRDIRDPGLAFDDRPELR